MYRGSLQKNSGSLPSLQLSDRPAKMPPGRTGRPTPITLRVQVFALQEEAISVAKIREITRLAISAIYRIKQIAFEKGCNPGVCKNSSLD